MTTPPIDDQARALLSAWVEQRSPSAELEARTWAAVSARASAGELGPELGPELGLEPASSVRMGRHARLHLAVGAGVTGVVALVLVLGRATSPEPDAATRATIPSSATDEAKPHEAADADPPEPAPEPDPAPEPPSEPVTPPTEPGSEPTASAPAPEPAPSVAREPSVPDPSGSASEPTSRSEPSEDPLAAELALLGRARAALKAGDPEAALTRLDEHAERFPAGALARERELTRITAACSAGDLDLAERVARRFVRAHPGSTEAKRLADTCVGDRLSP